jgi:hypothetical protein
MATVDLNENLSQIIQSLNVLERQQIPFAAARALTRVVAEFSRDILPQVLEYQLPEGNPTPFTKRGGRYIPADKQNLMAVFYLAQLQDRYLRFQVRGGTRIQKGFEKKYESIAKTIERRKLVPGKGAKLNQYGNVSRATIERIGQELEKPNGRVYVGRLKNEKRTFGIWQRYKARGADGKMVGRVRAIFVEPPQEPSYQQTLRLRDALENYAKNKFEFHLRVGLALYPE